MDTHPTHRRHLLIHLAVIVAAIAIAWCRIPSAAFLNWDDGEYVSNNPWIRSLAPDNIKAWFSTFFVGNYQPITMLSYAVDYAIGGPAASVYHTSSILLHMVNACLVYVFFSKLQPQKAVALFTALLFALSPVQAESVSWIAERKTLVSTFFSLLALLQYQGYIRRSSAGRMALVTLLSALAILAKATAVVLPFLFMATDVWLQLPAINSKAWVPRIPALAISVLLGIVAIQAQQAAHFMEGTPHTVVAHIAAVPFAWCMYIVRFFVPIGLSAMYPWPVQWGIAQWTAIAGTCVAVALWIRQWKKGDSVLHGGLLFFTISLLPVLQIIPFGEALMADRYLYMACIGLAYPAAYYVAKGVQYLKREQWLAAPVAIMALLFTTATYLRNNNWQNDHAFYGALLERFPESAVTQYSAGVMYLRDGNYDLAALHLDKAVRLEPNNAKAWYNKGLLHMRTGQVMDATEAFNNSIAAADYVKAYMSRGMLHLSVGNIDMALADINHVLQQQPDNGRAWCLHGDCMEKMGKTQDALTDYGKAISSAAPEPLFYLRRGTLLYKMNQYEATIADMNSAMELGDQRGEPYYWRGLAKNKINLSACADLIMAARMHYAPAHAALAQLCHGQ